MGHLFYYGENGSILDTYFTMEKWINIGHIFNSYYSGETDQFWTHILLWRNGFVSKFYKCNDFTILRL